MAASELCHSMRFWSFNERFLFEPLEASTKGTLAVSRPDGQVSIVDGPPRGDPSKASPRTIYGIMGMIDLLAGPYVVIITQRTQVGTLRGSPVYSINHVEIHRCALNLKRLKVNQRADEELYVRMLKNAVTSPGLFYSYGADITTTSQKEYSAGAERRALPLWQQSDPRFHWNRHLLEPLIGIKGAEPFLIPIMQGSFAVLRTSLKARQIDLTLVGRRNIHRIGTRMWRRGADQDGAVANFVETEQILEAEGSLATFVQVRGSVPLMWEQVVDLKYKPKIKIINAESATLQRHMKNLQEVYGPVIAVDLVNQKGSEAKLGAAFANGVDSMHDGSIKHVPFDFHKECKNGRYDRLSLLYDKVSPDLAKFGFFMARGRETLKEQKGVARTNCLDCLDRTNVTQSMLARRALEAQLQTLRILEPSEVIKDFPDFNAKFNVLWASHGDDVSKQYSGTGALKGDFVRYGKRSYYGVYQDGYNSIMRYYLNNFFDGLRQDGLDLVMGRYVVSPYAASPFRVTALDLVLSVPLMLILLAISLFMTGYAFTHIGQTGQVYAATVAFCWGLFALSIVWVLNSYGRFFTDRPRLRAWR